jgi:hypothetical protein
MTDFDDPLVAAWREATLEPTITSRVPRTAATAQRYAFLKTKRRGGCRHPRQLPLVEPSRPKADFLAARGVRSHNK